MLSRDFASRGIEDISTDWRCQGENAALPPSLQQRAFRQSSRGWQLSKFGARRLTVSKERLLYLRDRGTPARRRKPQQCDAPSCGTGPFVHQPHLPTEKHLPVEAVAESRAGPSCCYLRVGPKWLQVGAWLKNFPPLRYQAV